MEHDSTKLQCVKGSSAGAARLMVKLDPFAELHLLLQWHSTFWPTTQLMEQAQKHRLHLHSRWVWCNAPLQGACTVMSVLDMLQGCFKQG